jgi:aspartyl/asparaginyl beta-hydroxylase (cupin superfamily)
MSSQLHRSRVGGSAKVAVFSQAVPSDQQRMNEMALLLLVGAAAISVMFSFWAG